MSLPKTLESDVAPFSLKRIPIYTQTEAYGMCISNTGVRLSPLTHGNFPIDNAQTQPRT